MNEIFVYDQGGNTIQNLVQWDTNVSIFIKETNIDKAYTVHFFNTNSKEAMTMKSKFSGGTLEVTVPNMLLCEPYTITGYIYKVNQNEGRSIYCFRLPVRKRAKPEGYICVESPDYISVDKILSECRIYAESAKLSETNAKDSETKVAQNKSAVEQIKVDVTQLKTNVEQMKANITQMKENVATDKNLVTEMKTSVSKDKEFVTSMKNDVAQNKSAVEQIKVDVTQLKTDTLKEVKTEGAKQTQLVTSEGTKQVNLVSNKGVEQVKAVTNEGTKQKEIINTVAQGIVNDRLQINKNKEAIETKLNKNQGAENNKKVLVVTSNGNVVPTNPLGLKYDSVSNCLIFGYMDKLL